MSTTPAGKTRSGTPTVFEQQRAELAKEIAIGMEQVLININRLNRNLDSVLSVGKEFASVEALWSQFENYMGRPAEEIEREREKERSASRMKEEQGDEE
ncbi:DASH complex subunit Dad1-domain-containing protein [Aspergillus venezuelensis]|uniref:DASH complex subunit DAD1 n=1 Tax=Aspergillus stella-maris TaxID=1810926 RepID=UPI003CCCC855